MKSTAGFARSHRLVGTIVTATLIGLQGASAWHGMAWHGRRLAVPSYVLQASCCSHCRATRQLGHWHPIAGRLASSVERAGLSCS